MGIQYKLIGFINLFNIVPDFVLPVFDLNGDLFFQVGEYDQIKRFGKAKVSIREKIISNSPDFFSNISTQFFDIYSKPVYAFQNSEKDIVYGDSSFIRKYFKNYSPNNKVLASEISDFLKDLPSPVIYQPKVSTYYGTGRRKTSIARVHIFRGNGNILINDRDISNYFDLQNLKSVVCKPLCITNNLDNFDVKCKVSGGGFTGQAGAISLGIAKALLEYDDELRPILKSAGLLTRDPRMKERKKCGLKGARKASQFSKR